MLAQRTHARLRRRAGLRASQRRQLASNPRRADKHQLLQRHAVRQQQCAQLQQLSPGQVLRGNHAAFRRLRRRAGQQRAGGGLRGGRRFHPFRGKAEHVGLQPQRQGIGNAAASARRARILPSRQRKKHLFGDVQASCRQQRHIRKHRVRRGPFLRRHRAQKDPHARGFLFKGRAGLVEQLAIAHPSRHEPDRERAHPGRTQPLVHAVAIPAAQSAKQPRQQIDQRRRHQQRQKQAGPPSPHAPSPFCTRSPKDMPRHWTTCPL